MNELFNKIVSWFTHALGVGLVVYFIVIALQPFYSAGLSMSMTPSGYRVYTVDRDSPAWRAGMRQGSVITAIDARSTIDLYELSRGPLAEYVAITTTLFQDGAEVALETVTGDTFRVPVGEQSLFRRVRTVDRTISSNFVFAAILFSIGFFFRHFRRHDPVTSLFVLFCGWAAVSVALSYFHSLWTLPVFRLHFVFLEIAGPITGAILVIFGLNFPNRLGYRPIVVVSILIAPILIKFGLLAAGVTALIGPAHYSVHAYLVLSIIAFGGIMAVQYRSADAGAKRRVRWVAVGSILSLLPYLLYLLATIVSRTFLEYENAGVFNQIAAFALLLFPVSIGIGLSRFDILDIDETATTLVRHAILGLILTVVGVLMFILTRNTYAAVLPIMFILFVTILGPAISSGLEPLALRIAGKSIIATESAFAAFRATVPSLHRRDDLYAAVCAFAEKTFSPEWMVLAEQRDGTVEILRNTRRGIDPDTLRTTIADLPRSDTSAAIVNRTLFCRCRAEETREVVLCIGPKRNNDIYVERERRLLSELTLLVNEADRASQYLSQIEIRTRELETSLTRQQDLMKEMHHRVKNNLQLMSSMINLQSGNTDSEDTRNSLCAVRDRVLTMAGIHESLYLEPELNQVDMQRYLKSVILGHAENSGHTPTLAIEPIVLPAPLALPCGLIVNELVANAVTHGSRGSEKRPPNITFSGSPDAFVLTVTDYGPPFPSDVNFSTPKTLGLLLVSILTRQLGGTFRVQESDGKECIVEFPRNDR